MAEKRNPMVPAKRRSEIAERDAHAGTEAETPELIAWRAVNRLCAVYERKAGESPISDEKHQAYQNLLRDLAPEILAAAVTGCAKKCKWFPTVAEIREEARMAEQNVRRIEDRREIAREREEQLAEQSQPRRSFAHMLASIGRTLNLPEAEPEKPEHQPLPAAEEQDRRELLRAQAERLISCGY